jgi:mono/diheme cytochrome c family protein
MLGNLRGKDGIQSSTSASPTGAALFSSNCASCHAANGDGSQDGYYPRLFHNSVTGSENPDNLIATMLFGVDRTTSSGQAYMPGFGGHADDPDQFNDERVALLANYVFEQYGRGGRAVTSADVATVRRGGPSSPLVPLARIGAAGSGLIVVLACLFLVYRRFNRKAARRSSSA